jgi:hypothetical protein
MIWKNPFNLGMEGVFSDCRQSGAMYWFLKGSVMKHPTLLFSSAILLCFCDAIAVAQTAPSTLVRPSSSPILQRQAPQVVNPRRSATVVPATFTSTAQRLSLNLTPLGTDWVQRNGLAFRAGTKTEAQIRQDASEQTGLLLQSFEQGQDADITTLVFIVMHVAAKDSRDDLRNQLVDVRRANQSRRETMSEMSEMESLNMQMAMDRMSKMMTALSNIMKKMSDTSASITNNIK